MATTAAVLVLKLCNYGLTKSTCYFGLIKVISLFEVIILLIVNAINESIPVFLCYVRDMYQQFVF